MIILESEKVICLEKLQGWGTWRLSKLSCSVILGHTKNMAQLKAFAILLCSFSFNVYCTITNSFTIMKESSSVCCTLTLNFYNKIILWNQSVVNKYKIVGCYHFYILKFVIFSVDNENNFSLYIMTIHYFFTLNTIFFSHLKIIIKKCVNESIFFWTVDGLFHLTMKKRVWITFFLLWPSHMILNS